MPQEDAARRRAAAAAEANRELGYSDSEDDILDSDDEALLRDPELEAIQERRRKQLMQQQAKVAENRIKGHGEYQMIPEDQFLTAVTKSKYVVCHFWHRDFQLCKVLDEHLRKIAYKVHRIDGRCGWPASSDGTSWCVQAVNTRFISMDVEKAPFFVSKLQVKVCARSVCL